MRVKPRSNKKKIITIISILSVVVASFLLWSYVFSDRSNNDKPAETTSKDTNKPKDAAAKDKDNTPEDSSPDQSVSHEKEKDLPQLYEGENVNNSNGLSGVITTKSVAGENLVIRNTIDQLVTSGTCELNLTSGSRVIKRSAEIIQNPSSSSCAGFDVPIAELGSGQWNIEIIVLSGDKSMTLKETVNI